MYEKLEHTELIALIERSFPNRQADKGVAIIVDLPDEVVPDTELWATRREMALGWYRELAGHEATLGLPVSLYHYRNAHRNNADLPNGAIRFVGDQAPACYEDANPDAEQPFETVFESATILIAPTHFSATAPLKLAARTHGIRAATMPGFSPAMIPALRLDYGVINHRVTVMKELCDEAEGFDVVFVVDGDQTHELHLDLRFNPGHASGGLFAEAGVAGNLPSGETYIVPYEGNKEDPVSQSNGIMPVQFGDEVVLYEIVKNKAVRVISEGPESTREAGLLQAEPAYGNLAELGLGVLADFGLEPIGEILLDEKLGLHIAFGRSDHFGGAVGAKDFSSPDAVVHIDRVYLPALMPRVAVARATFLMPGDRTVELMRDGEYVFDFGEPA